MSKSTPLVTLWLKSACKWRAGGLLSLLEMRLGFFRDEWHTRTHTGSVPETPSPWPRDRKTREHALPAGHFHWEVVSIVICLPYHLSCQQWPAAMASKSSRKTTTTTYSSRSGSGTETPGTSTFSPRRRERPPSPARTTRQQEQEDLQGLNDRLANYIDKVRFLEAENSRLSTQIQSTEEVVKREVSSVKSLYESELSDARRLLDETAKEKARIQIEANKYKTDYEDLLAK